MLNLSIKYLLYFGVCYYSSGETIMGLDEGGECPGGVMLSSTICIPNGYRKGELPNVPLEINTAIEVNNIREILAAYQGSKSLPINFGIPSPIMNNSIKRGSD